MAAHTVPTPDGPTPDGPAPDSTTPDDPAPASAAEAESAGPADASKAGSESTAAAASTIARTWELRRRAEKKTAWQRPVMGALGAIGFALVANPELLPGGTAIVLVAYAVVVVALIIIAVVAARRASFRGHSGSVEMPEAPGRRWWRRPELAPLLGFSLIFGGRAIGAFDHWPVIFACAAVAGVAIGGVLPRYETADHINGARLENPPVPTPDTVAAVDGGELATDVLELLVLQHHTGERRVAWCADVLGTDTADIADRISRGRRWLEFPATEVHDPARAAWIRLSAAGREALGYT